GSADPRALHLRGELRPGSAAARRRRPCRAGAVRSGLRRDSPGRRENRAFRGQGMPREPAMSPAAGIFTVLLAVGWMWLVGGGVGPPVCASLVLPEVLAWGLACGLLFQGRFYEGLLLAGVRPRAGVLLAAGGAVIAFSLLRRSPAGRSEADRTSRRGWALAAALSIPW